MKIAISLLLLTICICQSTLATPLHQKIESSLGKSARIIGGTDAVASQFRFMVAITVTKPDGRYFCAGTLWGNQWVITAGQCAYEATLFTLDFGSHYLTTADSNRQTASTSTSYIHPDFQPMTLQNDIALIKLRLPIEHNDNIKSIDLLPDVDVPLDRTMPLQAIGWGQTSDANTQLSEVLQYVSISSITNAECRAVYANQVTDNMICVAGNNNEGTCTGDTGSPIVLASTLGLFIQYGVASFHSQRGCETADPSGYTRTYPYREWIIGTTADGR